MGRLGLNTCPNCGEDARSIHADGDPLDDEIVLIRVEHDRHICHVDFDNAGYWLDDDRDVFLLKPYQGTPERLFQMLEEIGRRRRCVRLLN